MLKKLLFWVVVLAGAHYAWKDPDIRQQIENYIAMAKGEAIATAQSNAPKFKTLSVNQLKSVLLDSIADMNKMEEIFLEEMVTSRQAVLDFQKEWCGNSYLHPVLRDKSKEQVCTKINSMQQVLSFN
ncbi:hypothetical protein C2869_08980 [Saccharobesus litoralis]|uniref:Uncharacterized protein n=1 Tax=Saccharobesus litoralis TaxID=2172099 RepID=A0A2S0VQR3_9ALTE|nr:hypothetical protein [Saccharobesus litoralis]AWB66555.1 hypothetical protein C2869_08980 [Saccharobesus litoralis]